ncbi:hypothetical protein RIF29_00804 [Crotalaria pallida]|uniref:Uncharacterized protein n=1 Tax=Crotalaria pallida TaxID=3830 RepID=A0AAN9P6R5_CROPI
MSTAVYLCVTPIRTSLMEIDAMSVADAVILVQVVLNRFGPILPSTGSEPKWYRPLSWSVPTFNLGGLRNASWLKCSHYNCSLM